MIAHPHLELLMPSYIQSVMMYSCFYGIISLLCLLYEVKRQNTEDTSISFIHPILGVTAATCCGG